MITIRIRKEMGKAMGIRGAITPTKKVPKKAKVEFTNNMIAEALDLSSASERAFEEAFV